MDGHEGMGNGQRAPIFPQGPREDTTRHWQPPRTGSTQGKMEGPLGAPASCALPIIGFVCVRLGGEGGGQRASSWNAPLDNIPSAIPRDGN